MRWLDFLASRFEIARYMYGGMYLFIFTEKGFSQGEGSQCLDKISFPRVGCAFL